MKVLTHGSNMVRTPTCSRIFTCFRSSFSHAEDQLPDSFRFDTSPDGCLQAPSFLRVYAAVGSALAPLMLVSHTNVYKLGPKSESKKRQTSRFGNRYVEWYSMYSYVFQMYRLHRWRACIWSHSWECFVPKCFESQTTGPRKCSA